MKSAKRYFHTELVKQSFFSTFLNKQSMHFRHENIFVANNNNFSTVAHTSQNSGIIL